LARGLLISQTATPAVFPMRGDTMSRFLIASLGFGLLAGAMIHADDDKKPAKLNGTYTITAGEEDGKPIPAARFEGAVVIFTDDTVAGTDKEKKEIFSSKYKLDAAKKPWAIHMKTKEPKEAESQGLVKMEGDTVTIIYAKPGGEKPTEFKTKENQHMFVMKKKAD
jgi:uncharacterized protein (TIGR03067 family)